MHSTDDVYAERGLGERQGAGKRPAYGDVVGLDEAVALLRGE